MTDVHTKMQRSFNMSRIKGQNTKPELLLRKELWRRGYRYRLKSSLPGKPDIVFPGRKVAIFVDGCFWHKCPLHYQPPKNNAEFWQKKIDGNVARDLKVTAELEVAGWQVLRLWEHEVKNDLQDAVHRIIGHL